jgi:hypothetical protein
MYITAADEQHEQYDGRHDQAQDFFHGFSFVERV